MHDQGLYGYDVTFGSQKSTTRGSGDDISALCELYEWQDPASYYCSSGRSKALSWVLKVFSKLNFFTPDKSTAGLCDIMGASALQNIHQLKIE
jgi:hypothetical protein